jgi:hypothetical protein
LEHDAEEQGWPDGFEELFGNVVCLADGKWRAVARIGDNPEGTRPCLLTLNEQALRSWQLSLRQEAWTESYVL